MTTPKEKTKEELQQEFANLAAALGSKQFQIQLLGAEIQAILVKMNDLNNEGKKIQDKPAEQQPE